MTHVCLVIVGDGVVGAVIAAAVTVATAVARVLTVTRAPVQEAATREGQAERDGRQLAAVEQEEEGLEMKGRRNSDARTMTVSV